jgi:putative flippase GtrA
MSFLRTISESRWATRLVHHFPPGQFGRYLVVGICNTVFGYSTYAVLTALLTPHIPFAYVIANLIAGLMNITFSFLNYKWFVFRTRGGYLREWSRCIVVYGGTMLLGTAVLPVTVFLLRQLTPADRSAPYIAGAIQMGAGVIASFLGHKNFSFAPAGNGVEEAVDRAARGDSKWSNGS